MMLYHIIYQFIFINFNLSSLVRVTLRFNINIFFKPLIDDVGLILLAQN